MLTDEQRIARRNGLGASDSAIIMGYSTFKTPYQLYLEKTGLVTAEDEETEQQYWGNALESAIIKRFSEDNAVEVSFPDTVYHPDYNFIFANLDGWVADKRWVVEAKCANSFQRKAWDAATSDGIPLSYLIQIAKQCLMTDAELGFCAVLIGGNEYMQFTYERDAALEAMILKADLKFWECVQKRIEPDPTNTNDCRLKFREPMPDSSSLITFTVANALTSLVNLKLESKTLSEREDRFKMAIMKHMGNTEYLVDQTGEVLVTWKANKKGSRVFNIKGISL